ncbi:MAG: hypothetical protein CMN93_04835 [Synechococcus sp. CPC35]|nr:hypothetical protein [Synechococcus sp. CPC35]
MAGVLKRAGCLLSTPQNNGIFQGKPDVTTFVGADSGDVPSDLMTAPLNGPHLVKPRPALERCVLEALSSAPPR